MDFLVALDVLLGLSLVYLVYSLAVTSINEFIAATLSSRARWLRKGIASLLSPDPTKLADDKADEVLDSPFLAHLGTPGVWKTFRASYVSAWPLIQGVLSRVPGFKEDAFARVSDIRMLAEQLPPKSPIRNILIDLCARANGDLAHFQEMLEAWFKTFEDQLSAWYRQKTQYVLVGLSFFVAAAMNVDTIDIVRQLSADPKLRGQLVEQGMEVANASDLEALMATGPRDRAREAHEQALQIRRETEEMVAAACPAGDAEPAVTAACADGRNKLAAVTKDEELKRAALAEQRKALDLRIKERADKLSATGLMIGWRSGQLQQWLGGMPSAQGFEKLMGLLLSAFALALGAPFWFNVLKSVASVRSVGQNIREKEAELLKK